MKLTKTDFNMLNAVAVGSVSPGTLTTHFVDYCGNNIGGNPQSLIDEGYIDANHGMIQGLTDKVQKAWEALKDTQN